MEKPRPKIITMHVFPPISIQDFDWQAVRDGYEGPDGDGVGGDPIGWGSTEEAAIADLLEREEEKS